MAPVISLAAAAKGSTAVRRPPPVDNIIAATGVAPKPAEGNAGARPMRFRR